MPSTVTGLKTLLGRFGYAVRERQDGDGVLLAAKKGSANRLGMCAHAAMVIICIGGLLDSELPVRLVMFGGKKPIVENMLISEVPESGRLSVNNPSFRASVLVPEDGQASTAVVMVGDGALVQPMPFTLKLKKFVVDYYSTGMPSRFASEVVVTDPDTGKSFESTIEVNEPLRFKGMTVYQSSFDDGGSTVALKGYPLVGAGDATSPWTAPWARPPKCRQTARGPRSMGVEITALRPINVEDLTRGDPKGGNQSFAEHVASVAGSAAGKKNENLRNVGPSVEYKLIDDAGQAHEFQNYMLPVELDGATVFLAGVRNNASESFRYLRIPADDDSSVAEFMRLRAAGRSGGAPGSRAPLRRAQQPVGRRPPAADGRRARAGNLRRRRPAAVAAFLQANTPPADLERAADVVIRLIGASMNELRAIERERAGRRRWRPRVRTASARRSGRGWPWRRCRT